MVTFTHVSKKIGNKEVLNNINCQLEHGVYGLLGPNGAGKTTLMRCMTNIYQTVEGDIAIDGVSVKKKHKNKVGYLPQGFGLFKELSVYDSMQYFCNLKGIERKKREKEIEECLKAVYLLEKKKCKSGSLSGGMLRRVGIAQALLGKPELILFDEPTAGLDPEERMHFKSILSSLGKEETVVISTHIVEDIEACCDYVLVMNRGEIYEIGTCEDIRNHALGKVFECPISEADKLEGKFFIEKQYEKEGVIYYRILAGNSYGMKEVTPTLEDGYMCIIKNI